MILGYTLKEMYSWFFFYKLVIVKPQPLVYKRAFIQLTIGIAFLACKVMNHYLVLQMWSSWLKREYILNNYLVLLYTECEVIDYQ